MMNAYVVIKGGKYFSGFGPAPHYEPLFTWESRKARKMDKLSAEHQASLLQTGVNKL